MKKTQKSNTSPNSITSYPKEYSQDNKNDNKSVKDEYKINEYTIDKPSNDEYCDEEFPIENENLNELNGEKTSKPQLKKKKIKKRTTRKKYKCGKSKTKKIISVLIKDPNTKDKITNEKNKLNITPLRDVKKYLYDRSFIKFGSNAPDDVLRTMYESCVLSGDIKNDNSEMIIHNYFNST